MEMIITYTDGTSQEVELRLNTARGMSYALKMIADAEEKMGEVNEVETIEVVA